MLYLVILAAAVLQATAAPPAPILKLPEYMETCRTTLPEYDECLRSSIQKLVVRFSKGAPEFDMLPLDPFHVPEFLIEYQNGDVTGKMLVKNSNTYGLTDTNIVAVRSNLNDSNTFHLEVDIQIPSTLVEGDYKAQGKIVVFPINGKGVYNISMTDIRATWNLTGEFFRKGGHEFVRITRFDMFPQVGNMKIYASNLFTGNDDFNRAALAFANEFWSVLYQEMLPFVNEGWDRLMRGVVNKIFTRVPFRLLFPDN